MNRTERGNAVLGLAAVLLAALLAVQMWRPAPAEGAVVSRAGGLTVLTCDAGNEDILVILDERNEWLNVYRTDGRLGVQLLQRLPLPDLFAEARARSLGRP